MAGRRSSDLPVQDILRELKDSLDRVTNPSTRIGGADAGEWVVVGTLWCRDAMEGVPVMEPVKRRTMRRYETKEEAIAASVQFSAVRVGGGWALNLATGETVRIRRYEGGRVV